MNNNNIIINKSFILSIYLTKCLLFLLNNKNKTTKLYIFQILINIILLIINLLMFLILIGIILFLLILIQYITVELIIKLYNIFMYIIIILYK